MNTLKTQYKKFDGGMPPKREPNNNINPSKRQNVEPETRIQQQQTQMKKGRVNKNIKPDDEPETIIQQQSIFNVSQNNTINVPIDLGLVILFFFDMIHDFCETPVLMSTKKNAKDIIGTEIDLIIKMFDATFSSYSFFLGQRQDIISDVLTKIKKIINENEIKYSRDAEKETSGQHKRDINNNYIFEKYTYQRIYDDLMTQNNREQDKNKILYEFITKCFENTTKQTNKQVSAHSFLERGHKLCYFIASVINDKYFFKKHSGLIDMACSNTNQPSKLAVNVELQQCRDYNTIGDNALLLTNETDYNILQLPNISSRINSQNKYFDLFGREIHNKVGRIIQEGGQNIVRPIYLVEDALKSTSKVSLLQSCVCSSAEGNNVSTSKEMYVLYTTSGFYDEAANKLACYEPLAIPKDGSYIDFEGYSEIQSNMKIQFTNTNTNINQSMLSCNFEALNEQEIIARDEDYKQQLFKYFRVYYTRLLNDDKTIFKSKIDELKNTVKNNWVNGKKLSFIFGSLLLSDDKNQGNYYGQLPNALSSALKSEYNTKKQMLNDTTNEIVDIDTKLRDQNTTAKEKNLLIKENKKLKDLKDKLEKQIKKLDKDIEIALGNDKANYEMSKTADNIAPKMVDALKTFISDKNDNIGFSVPSKKTIFKRIRELSDSFGFGIVGYEEDDVQLPFYGSNMDIIGDSDGDEVDSDTNSDTNRNLQNDLNTEQITNQNVWNPQQEGQLDINIIPNPIMDFDRHYINILTFSKNGTIIVDYDNDIGDDKNNDIITKIQQITIPEMVKKMNIKNEDLENFIRLLFNFYVFDSETMEENIENNNPLFRAGEDEIKYINKSPVLELFNLYSEPSSDDYFQGFINGQTDYKNRRDFISKAKTKKVNLQIEKGGNKTDNIPDASVTDISQLFREKLFRNLKPPAAIIKKFIEDNIGTRTDGISDTTSKTLIDIYNKNKKELTQDKLVQLFMILFRKTMGDFSQIATVKHLSKTQISKPFWFISFDVMAGIIALYHGTNTITVRLSDGKLNDGYVLYGSDMLKYEEIKKPELSSLVGTSPQQIYNGNSPPQSQEGNSPPYSQGILTTPEKDSQRFSPPSTQMSDFSQVSAIQTDPRKEKLIVPLLENTSIVSGYKNYTNEYVDSGPDKEIKIVYFKMEQNMCKYIRTDQDVDIHGNIYVKNNTNKGNGSNLSSDLIEENGSINIGFRKNLIKTTSQNIDSPPYKKSISNVFGSARGKKNVSEYTYGGAEDFLSGGGSHTLKNRQQYKKHKKTHRHHIIKDTNKHTRKQKIIKILKNKLTRREK